MVYINRIKRGFRNNEEIIIILVSSIIITYALLNIDFIWRVFLEERLSVLLFSFFGALFGLLLTAYVTFFAIVPQLNEELRKSENFNKIHTEFLVAIFLTLVVLITSLFLFFNLYWSVMLFIFLIFLAVFDVMLFLLIVTYLFLLFRIVYL